MELKLDSAIEYLYSSLLSVRTGRANSSMLDSIKVNYHNCNIELSKIALVVTVDSRLLVVKPFDPTSVIDIEKAISQSTLGLTPQRSKDIIRIPIPPLSEDRRQQLVKHVKKIGEEQKIAIRSIRKAAVTEVNNVESLPEDGRRKTLEKIDNLTKNYVDRVDIVVEGKISLVLDTENRWKPNG